MLCNDWIKYLLKAFFLDVYLSVKIKWLYRLFDVLMNKLESSNWRAKFRNWGYSDKNLEITLQIWWIFLGANFHRTMPFCQLKNSKLTLLCWWISYGYEMKYIHNNKFINYWYGKVFQITFSDMIIFMCKIFFFNIINYDFIHVVHA